VCFACHDTGAAGAPKHGDKAAWAPFVATGLDTMVQNAIHGVGAMPPRGGSQATDAEMKAAVQYIMEAVK
jgi:cytochrome c5